MLVSLSQEYKSEETKRSYITAKLISYNDHKCMVKSWLLKLDGIVREVMDHE